MGVAGWWEGSASERPPQGQSVTRSGDRRMPYEQGPITVCEMDWRTEVKYGLLVCLCIVVVVGAFVLGSRSM